MGYVRIIASRYLRSKRRLHFITLVSLLAIGGVFVGVAALTIVLSVMNGFEDQVQQRIAGTNAHVAVLDGGDRPLHADPALERTIRDAVPGAEVAPFVYGKGKVASRHGVDGVVLKGVDPDRERRVTDILTRLTPADVPFDGGDLPGIALGEELALRLRVTRGDMILISIPSEEPGGFLGGVPRSRRLRVGSIFRSGLYEYDSSFGVVPLQTAQEFFGLGSDVTGFELRLVDMFRAREASQRIETVLG